MEFLAGTTIAKKHISPALGKIQLAKLTPQHIQRLLADKAKTVKDDQGNVITKALSPATITNIRTVLRSALAQAVKFNLIARNPAALVDAPRIPHKEVVPLDASQANRLLEAAQGNR